MAKLNEPWASLATLGKTGLVWQTSFARGAKKPVGSRRHRVFTWDASARNLVQAQQCERACSVMFLLSDLELCYGQRSFSR